MHSPKLSDSFPCRGLFSLLDMEACFGRLSLGNAFMYIHMYVCMHVANSVKFFKKKKFSKKNKPSRTNTPAIKFQGHPQSTNNG